MLLYTCIVTLVGAQADGRPYPGSPGQPRRSRDDSVAGQQSLNAAPVAADVSRACPFHIGMLCLHALVLSLSGRLARIQG